MVVVEITINKPMVSNKVIFYTYGDKEKYNISKKHLIHLIKLSNVFDKTYSFSKYDIPKSDLEPFKSLLKEFRGGGFWIWKYLLLEKLINDTNENDLIVYSDAGSSFNYHAKNRLLQYFDMLNSSDFGNFRIESEKNHLEKFWTTKEIFNYFNVSDNKSILESTQLLGGHLIFKNCEHTKDLLNIFFKLIKKNKELITDYYNQFQDDEFIENRHDQSIWSVLSKKYGGVIIENETYFKDRRTEQFNYPFLSVRNYGHGKKDSLKYYLNLKNYKSNPVYF